MTRLRWLAAVVVLGKSTGVMAEAPVAQFQFSVSAPQRGAFTRDVDTLKLPVTAVEVDGATAYLPAEFQPLFAKVVGHAATVAELAAIAEAIEARYRADGYLLVRAAVPAQQPSGGIFHITVTEETIGSLVVEGAGGRTRERIEALLAPVLSERPIRAATVERALLLANDLPGVKATGSLRTNREGGTDLVVTVVENAFDVVLSADNSASRYAGPWLFSADVTANAPFGYGEQLGLGATLSADATQTRAFRGRWVMPLGQDGLQATTSVAVGRYEGGYTMLVYGEVEHTVQVAERLSWPVLRSRERSLLLEGGFTYNDTSVDMLGTNAYSDQWRVSNLGLTWRESGWPGSGSTVLSLGVAQGLPVLGASSRGGRVSRDTEGDPLFTKLTLEAGGKWWLDPAWSVQVALAGQYGFSTLLEGEEFSVGGYRFGRGFDPSCLLGDQGVAGTAELQYQFPLEILGEGVAQVFAFVDHGRTWEPKDHVAESLLSTGVGVRANLSSNLSVTLQIAHPLYGPDSTVPNDPVRPYVSAVVRF